MAAALARKEIAVIGAFYEISSGAVEFIEGDASPHP
jgi:carbonic anhydrase